MLKDYIVEMGYEAVKNKIVDIDDRKQIKDSLCKYMEMQECNNYCYTHEEEIDFEGLTKYICDGFLGDVSDCLFGLTPDIRERANEKVLSTALVYANQNSQLSTEHVRKYLSDAFSILRSFYYSKLPQSSKYGIAVAVDNITAINATQHEEQTRKIESTIQKAEQNVSSSMILSMDNNIRLIREGKIDSVKENLTCFMQVLSSQHVLKPFYGFDLRQSGKGYNIMSVPFTDEGLRSFPPRIKCDGKIEIGGEPITKLTPNTLAYSKNHQVPITLTIDHACKFLGNVVDPQQCEAEELLGEQIVLPPEPFPQAMPYSIMIDDVTIYEYVLLRTEEVFEDDTAVFSNKEQNIPFLIHLIAKPSLNSIEFSFKIQGGTTRDLLNYRQFLRATEAGERFAIHHLASGRNLCEGSLNHASNGDERIAALDDEIAFLKKVIAIETYFRENIDVPEQVSRDDADTVDYVSAIIQNKEVKGYWTKYDISLTIGKDTKEKIATSPDEDYSLTYIGSVTASVFGHNLTFTCQRTLLSVALDNYEKTRKKLDVLDEGETIRLVYVPGSHEKQGLFIDQLSKQEDIS